MVRCDTKCGTFHSLPPRMTVKRFKEKDGNLIMNEKGCPLTPSNS